MSFDNRPFLTPEISEEVNGLLKDMSSAFEKLKSVFGVRLERAGFPGFRLKVEAEDSSVYVVVTFFAYIPERSMYDQMMMNHESIDSLVFSPNLYSIAARLIARNLHAWESLAES